MCAEASKNPSQSTLSNRQGCAACGIVKKSGKRSCCARGGAWFKNCGDAGDGKFDHTWTEGIQACKGVASSISVKLSLKEYLLLEASAMAYTINTTLSQNATQQAQMNIYRTDSMPNTVTMNSKYHVGLAHVIAFISALLVIARVY